MQTQTSKMWPIVVTDEVHQALVALKQHPTEPFHVVIARLLARSKGMEEKDVPL